MITVITNRHQIGYTDLVTHLKKCHHENVDRIIIREKDYTEHQLRSRIKKLKSDIKLKGIPLLVNGPYPLLETYGADGRHYTMAQYTQLEATPDFTHGVSVHSLEEIHILRNRSPEYLLYGHIFTTACKAGLPERGLDNLKMILESSNHPIVALGGITLSNYQLVLEKGCGSFALMSSVMQAEDPNHFLDGFKVNK